MFFFATSQPGPGVPCPSLSTADSIILEKMKKGSTKHGYFVYKFFFSYPVYNVGHCYDIGDTNNARNQNDAFRKILFRDRYTRSMAFSKPTFLWFTFSRMLSNLTDCRLCIMFFIYKATFNFLK